MSGFLQQILNIEEPLFSTGLRELEKATGQSGVDVRLIANMTHMAHDVMRQLGLDTANTMPQELYAALNASITHGSGESILFDTDFVLLPINDEVVSFNLIDVIENHHHQLAYADRIMNHGQRSLRGELIKRYLDHSRTDKATTEQLAVHTGLLLASDNDYNEMVQREKSNSSINAKAPYILAIGDMVTDAFIKLREDQARIDEDDKGNKRLSMEFGSKPPYDSVDIIQAVGNSANAAVSFSRLGIRAGLVAFIGDDQPGKDSLDYLKTEHVDTAPISIQKGLKSNYHYALRYGADRTILIKYEDYDYTWKDPTTTPDWIYLSMISESAWQLHVDLLKYLEAHPDIKLVFQPGTFHFEWGSEKLKAIYQRSYMVCMNKEEAALVTGKETDSVPELMKALHAMGPEIVIVSDGPNGAYASDKTTMLSIPNYPDPAPPFDRTGAGDAFASTITAALASGETLETALLWAPINSMSVVQKLGAQAGLLNKNEINEWLKKAPADYHPTEITT
jgi:ribokinase